MAVDDAFIKTLSGGRFTDFSLRSVYNKDSRFWEDLEANRLILCARVETPRGAREYRPLYQFDRLPPLDEIPLYFPLRRGDGIEYDEVKDRQDHAVIEAIQSVRGG